MRIQKSNKKTLVLAAVIIGFVLVIVAGIVVCALTHHTANNLPASSSGLNGINYSQPTADQQSNGSATKSNSVSQDGKPNVSGSDQPPAPTPIPDSSKSSVTVSITSPSPQSGDTIYVNAFVGTVTNSGTCTLTFTKTATSQVVSKQVGVQASSTITACKGFTLSKTADNFGTGQWTAVVTFNNDTLTGQATKTFTIE